MKAAVLVDKRKFQVMDIPQPTPEHDGDVLLKVEAVGVCGSDLHYYLNGKIGSQKVNFPFIIGHECAGTVIDYKGQCSLKKGQVVAIDPAISCMNCDQCKEGREHTCRNLIFLGCPNQAEGALREYIVMPQRCLYPTALPAELAVLAEPLSIALHAIKLAGGVSGKDIAVLGTGPIGLSVLLASKVYNRRQAFATDLIDSRLRIAEEKGKADIVLNPTKSDIVGEFFKKLPLGLDLVFECAGKQEAIDQAIELLKPGGKLILIGIPEEEEISIRIDLARRKELSMINVRRQQGCVSEAVRLLESGDIDAGFMITHRFSLEDTPKAFDLVAGYKDGIIKALIRP